MLKNTSIRIVTFLFISILITTVKQDIFAQNFTDKEKLLIDMYDKAYLNYLEFIPEDSTPFDGLMNGKILSDKEKKAIEYLQEGMILETKNKIDSAFILFDSAYTLFENQEHILLPILDYHRLNALYRTKAKLSLDSLVKSIELWDNKYYTYYKGLYFHGVANCFEKNGKYEQEIAFRDSAVYYFKEYGQNSLLARAYTSKFNSIYFYDPAKALEVANQQIAHLNTMNTRWLHGKGYALKGMVLADMGKVKEAFENYFKAMKIYKDNDCKNLLVHADLLFRIVGILIRQGQYNKAEEYNRKLETLAYKVNAPIPIMRYHLLQGNIENKKGNAEEAISLLRKGLAVKSVPNHERIMLWYRIGEIFNQEGLVDSTYYAVQKIREINIINDPYYEGAAEGLLLEYYIDRKQYKKAEKIIQENLEYAISDSIKDMEIQSYQDLNIVYKEQGDYKKAEEYLQKYVKEIEKKNNKELTAEITEIRMDAEFDKEREITALKTEQEKALIKTQRNQAFILGGSGLSLASLAFGFLNALRKKNKQIEIKNEELVSLNNTKDTLFQIIGHDLKKPTIGFRNISKNINYLLEKKDYHKLQALGEEIDHDAKSLYTLTDNLLNWALVQKDAIKINIHDVKVADLVEENLNLFMSIASRKRITIESNIHTSLLVKADRNSLDTIIRNLLDNAIKFTNFDGHVKISARDTDGMIRLYVENSGEGFNTGVLESIRNDKSIKSSVGTSGEKGSGIGLDLIKILLQKNNGNILVNNNDEGGAIVQISLPKTG